MKKAVSKKELALTLAVVGYAAAVLGVDALASLNVHGFGIFEWHGANGWDYFKFVAWFVIPFLCCLPWMEWGYLGVKRWKRLDVCFLAALVGFGAITVIAMPLAAPAIRAAFPSVAHMPSSAKWTRRTSKSMRWCMSCMG